MIKSSCILWMAGKSGRSDRPAGLGLNTIIRARLFYDGTLLYYSSLDVPDIYTYDPSQETPTLFSKVKSQTFHVEKSDISIRNNRSKQLDYSITNSQVLNIFPNGASLYVMALEGTACLENDKYQTEDKFFTVYGASEKNNFVASYSYDSIFHNIIGKNYQAIGHYGEAEKAYMKSHYMVPCRIYPLVLLMEMYMETGEYEKAMETGNQILGMPVNPKNRTMAGLRKEVEDKMEAYEAMR